MRPKVALVAGTGIAAAATAVWLFPRAVPIVALQQSLTREIALARADSFFRAHSLAPASARTAVRFQGDDALRTFIELAGGGLDSLNALLRGKDIAPFTWSVRAFVPGDVREARVSFAADGRIVGFARKLAESDRRPAISADSGRRVAEQLLNRWINDRADRWHLVTSSYETQKTSGRIDRSYTFERTDRRIGGAPIRAEAVIAGNTPSRLRTYVEIPQSFQRRYAEMRAWNDLLALFAAGGMVGLAILGAVALRRYAQERRVRWRPALLVATAIGGLVLAAVLNGIPGNWFAYDTAMSPITFKGAQVLLALLAGIGSTLLVGLTLAAAEASARHAFPRDLDWWKLWHYRGTREVAYRVGGGYAVAAISFAYVAAFYVGTRTVLGWWVPGELLDDPNQIASPMPWITGTAMSAQAAVWEESMFRALPLSLLSLWVAQRPGRRWWMAAGVIGSALIFAFGHSNYESWPPYSRGVEIFLDACFWAVLFLQFGLLVTVVAHFVYDSVLFGLFAGAGSSPGYGATFAIIAVAVLTPALAVLWRGLRQRGFTPAPEEARFSSWIPGALEETARSIPAAEAVGSMLPAGRLAIAAAIAAAVVSVGRPPRPALGPEFTVGWGRITQTADSILRARGVDPAGWTRLAAIQGDSQDEWQRFLRDHRIVAEAERLASSYAPPTWWEVRYVHTAGSAAARAEEWKVRLMPDNRPLEVAHILPDSAGRGAADSAAVRRIAEAALVRERLGGSTLRETEFEEQARPRRMDVRVTYTDTAVTLPAGAAARVRVIVAGNEPLRVHRAVELPEAFLRAGRARQTNRMLIIGVVMLVLAACVIGGVIVVRSRLPALINDGVLSRKTSLLLISGVAVLATSSRLNSLRSDLSSYDTAKPWGTFIATTALSFLGPILFALILVALLRVLEALRRRVGIPMVPGGPGRSARADVLIAGLGLGGIFCVARHLDALASPALPVAPSTGLGNFIPALTGVPEIPASAISAVLGVGIPILVIAGLTRRLRWRALLALPIVMLVVATTWSLGPTDDVDLVHLELLVASAATIAVAIMGWGGRSAWSWFVAALTYQGFEGLRDAIYGSERQARVAGGLTVIAATALIGLILHRAGVGVRRRDDYGGSVSDEPRSLSVT